MYEKRHRWALGFLLLIFAWTSSCGEPIPVDCATEEECTTENEGGFQTGTVAGIAAGGAAALALAGGAISGGGESSDSGGSSGSGGSSTGLVRPEAYELVWSDEFESGASPDTSRWTFDLGSQLIGGTVWGNNEKQFYTSDADNVYLEDGKLVIQAKYETTAGAPSGVIATSARLKTDTSNYWQAVGSEPYGFYEVRAKIPCIRGAWPAIWMLGKDGVWPDRGEIDITEWFGAFSDEYTLTSAVHNGAFYGGDLGNAPSSNPQTAQQKLTDLCTTYHNFQLHWTASSLVIGVDNVPTLTYRKTSSSNAQWPFDQPAFLLLNVAVGGNLGGSVNPSDISKMTMYVDYVRIWQLEIN